MLRAGATWPNAEGIGLEQPEGEAGRRIVDGANLIEEVLETTVAAGDAPGEFRLAFANLAPSRQLNRLGTGFTCVKHTLHILCQLGLAFNRCSWIRDGEAVAL